MRGPRSGALIVLLGALVGLSGCTGEAGVVVTVDAEPEVGSVAQLLFIVRAGNQTREFVDTLKAAAPIPPQRTLEVLAPGDLGSVFSLHVDALDGAGGMLAAADAQTTISAGNQSSVTLMLAKTAPSASSLAASAGLAGGADAGADAAGPVAHDSGIGGACSCPAGRSCVFGLCL